MKKLKQISKVFLLVLFLTSFNYSHGQFSGIPEAENSNFFQKAEISLNNSRAINKSQFIKSEYLYYKKNNARITITYDDVSKMLLSIHDSSNTFSDELIAEVIDKVNSNNKVEDTSNEDTNYMVAANTTAFGCAWWQLLCQVAEALCEGMGQESDCFE